MEKRARYAVVGATGTVGREVLAALMDAEVRSEDISVFASPGSAGEEVEYGEDSLEIESLEAEGDGAEAFRGIDVVILAVPAEVVPKVVRASQAAGAWTVDVSPVHRLAQEVPLVLPAVNLKTLDRPFKGRLVATPGPVTAAVATVLEPLRTGFGARRAFVTALLGTSSQGKRGISELEKQTAGLLSGREDEAEVFPHRIGFNLIPQVGEALADGATSEERSWSIEAAKVWSGGGISDAPLISGTAIQVPTFYGHAFTLTVELNRDAAAPEIRDALRAAPGIKVLDALDERVYPMPMLVTADPTVHVGRIRGVPGAPRHVELFAVIDNAGRGAAWNAVDVARALLRRRS